MKPKGYIFVQRDEKIIPIDISRVSDFDYEDYEDVRKTLNAIKGVTGYLVILTDRK